MGENNCTIINTSSINYLIDCVFVYFMTCTVAKKCNIFTAKAIRYQCIRSLTDKWIRRWSYLILP